MSQGKQPEEVKASKEELLSHIERIEKLNEDEAAVKADLKEAWSEVKSAGFDTKAVKRLIKLRSMDRDEIAEQDEILKLYRQTLGI